MSTTLIIIAVAAAVFLVNAVKILQEYERGVVFFLGRYQRVKGPGLIILIPFLQKMVKVDLRVVVMDVPTQDVISKDNVSVKVNAVIYFRIVGATMADKLADLISAAGKIDLPQRREKHLHGGRSAGHFRIVGAEKAIINVANVFEATSQLAQTTLRSVLGQHDLDDMLSERDKLNADIQAILDTRTDNWGIKVANVEIKHVDLDESMIRAIAQQAEAERARRAKVINAEGEKQAAQMLAEAARTLAGEKQALQLRYLQTLKDIAGEQNSTIVFPLPIDLITPLKSFVEKLPPSGRDD